jgi:hypothetical protein
MRCRRDDPHRYSVGRQRRRSRARECVQIVFFARGPMRCGALVHARRITLNRRP